MQPIILHHDLNDGDWRGYLRGAALDVGWINRREVRQRLAFGTLWGM
jgi:hypothetical protein